MGQTGAALFWCCQWAVYCCSLKKQLKKQYKNTNWRSTQLLTPHNPLFLSALLLRLSWTYVYLCHTHTTRNILHTSTWTQEHLAIQAQFHALPHFEIWLNAIHNTKRIYAIFSALLPGGLKYLSVSIPIHLNGTPLKYTIWNLPCD